MIQIDQAAPLWARRWARDASDAVDTAALSLFVSNTVYDATGVLPDPAKYVNRIILLSAGTFWLAKSDGRNWVYPDMTNV